jgi:hypothetical protein
MKLQHNGINLSKGSQNTCNFLKKVIFIEALPAWSERDRDSTKQE